MDLDKITAKLESVFPGLRKDGILQMARILALQVQNDEELESVIGKLSQEKVEGFIKDFRRDVDREVTDSGKKIEERLKAQLGRNDVPDNGKNDATKNQPGGSGSGVNDQPDIKNQIAEAVANQFKPIQDFISGFRTEREGRERRDRLNEILSTCKNKTFSEQTLKDFQRMSFKDEESFEQYLNEKKSDIETANQEFANSRLNGGIGAMLGGNDSSSSVSSAVSEYLKNASGEPKLGGKPLT